MCEAMTMIAGAGLLFTAMSGVMSTVGQRKQSNAQEQVYEYQAQLNERNAQIAAAQSAQSQQQAEADKTDLENKVSQIRGAGRTGFAGGNVALGSGSPVDWETDLGISEQYDKSKIDYNADMKSWDYGNDEISFNSQAELSRMAARSVNSGKNWQTGASLLSTAGTVGMGAWNVFGAKPQTQNPYSYGMQ